MLCSNSAPLVMSGMHAMMMLEVSMLGREVAPEEARPVMTMTACERGTWFSRMNLATAMAAAIAALFMQRMTTHVVSSWNANSAEPEGARAVMHDRGQSVLSKNDSSVALRRMMVWAMT